MLKMSPDLFARSYIRNVADPTDHFTDAFFSQKCCVWLWCWDDVIAFESLLLMFREIQCNKRDSLMFPGSGVVHDCIDS